MSIRDLVSKHSEKNNGGGFQKVGWFGLKDDGDSALVRILHSNIDDLEAYEVHKVEIDGYEKWVKCLGDDSCPLCREGNKATLKMWLFMLDLEERDKEKQLKVWQRGLEDIKLVISEIEENGDLNARNYKIKRNGKKGDNKTKYQYFAKDKEAMELPTRPNVKGWYMLELNEAEIKQVIAGEYHFPKKDEKKEEPTKVSGGEETF